MLHEVAEDGERLSPKAQLLAGFPESLILEIELKRRKRVQEGLPAGTPYYS